jgi:hypothetical protein
VTDEWWTSPVKQAVMELARLLGPSVVADKVQEVAKGLEEVFNDYGTWIALG